MGCPAEPIAEAAGLGLFTGVECSVKVWPGAPGSGIVFRKVDERGDPVADVPLLRASVGSVVANPNLPNVPKGFPVRNTTLAFADGSPAATVEHLLSALAAYGVWDAQVDLFGPEVPILDGSALYWAGPLDAAYPPNVWRERPSPLVLSKPITVEDRGASITAIPCDPLEEEYIYELDYGPASPIQPHRAMWNCENAWQYLEHVAPARTFSFEAEAAAAKKMGLFREFSPAQMPVVGADGQLIDNEWLSPGEPAAHKLLDLIGDLALLGRPLQARVVAVKSGHALTHALVRAVLEGE